MDGNGYGILETLRKEWEDNADFVYLTVDGPGGEAKVLFFKSLADEKTLTEKYLEPLTKSKSAEDFVQSYLSLSGVQEAQGCTQKELGEKVLRGNMLVGFPDGRIYTIDVKWVKNDEIRETSVESSIYGSKNALSEDLMVSVNLVRNRYPQTGLKVKFSHAGRVSQTPVAMIYDKDTVDSEVLEQVKKAFDGLKSDMIQSASELHRELTGRKYELMPSLLVTERPDRLAHDLMHGKVIFILQGTPFALIVPSVFFDFIAATDDIYQPFWVSRMLVILRYIGLAISLTLAAFYVAITSYNPEILRVQLTLSIAGSRAPVPYPSYVEVGFMLLMMEMLMEASIRMPKTVGSTATTVGGLILGQAATQAGLVSNIMIIIVASVAISNFVVPINVMSFSVRLLKFGFLLMATLFGIVGILVMGVALLAYVTNIHTFGQPYFRLFLDSDKHSKPKQEMRG